jgi:DhnA family fructose-bisphosphate aldolase class Ia
MNKSARLNRMFASDGRCLDVAIDHGVFNELTFVKGIENMHAAIETIVACNPDAIQLSVGQAPLLQNIKGKHKPALVLRVDVANVYGKQLPEHLFCELIAEPVVQAIRYDAACVVANLICNPGQPQLYHQCVQNIVSLKAQCDMYAMPLMVEPLVMKVNSEKGGYMVDGNIDLILPLVRQAAELGADVIKADPCDPVDQFHRIIEVASGVPVLPRGGGVTSEQALFESTQSLMNQGSQGIVYGRNIIQHARPAQMTQALMGIVHDQLTAQEALLVLHGEDNK